MKDETYVFIKDVQEKAQTARSAYKHRGRNKGCKLPFEDLDKRQRDKLNGEVITMDLNKPMKWSEFKKLDSDVQRKYVSRLRDVYNASNDALANMFGIHNVSLNKMFRVMGLTDTKKHRMTWQQKCSFEAFCNGGSVAAEETSENEVTMDSAEDNAREKIQTVVDEANNRLMNDSVVSAEDIITNLRKGLGCSLPQVDFSSLDNDTLEYTNITPFSMTELDMSFSHVTSLEELYNAVLRNRPLPKVMYVNIRIRSEEVDK